MVLLVLGGLLIGATGFWLRLGLSLIAAIMFWELAGLTGRRGAESRRLALAAMAGLAQLGALMLPHPAAMLLLAAPLIAWLPAVPARERIGFAGFGLAIMLVTFGLVGLREGQGLVFVLWLLGVVIISDTAGYFAGRIIGGPKFWPAISPKKTWSGTVAGWLGAALSGLALWAAGLGDASLIWISPLLALAGQMGDIAESWLKRRAGVKDASNLIPGHGGFMDRFDAVTGAVLAVMLIGLVAGLPMVG